MDVVKSLKRGKNGTQHFIERYGDELIAGRYRQGTEQQISYVTVELIVERKKILPKIQPNALQRTTAFVYACIGFYGKDLQAAHQ